MSNMTQITTLTVECSEGEMESPMWDPYFPQVLHTGWEVFASTLETLVLNVPNDLLGQPTRWIFPSQPLPHLQEITLHLTCSNSEREVHNRIIDTSLLPFLNANNRVKIFAVTVASTNFDIARLFNGLTSFPSLAKLNVVCLSSDSLSIAPTSDGIHNFASTRVPNLQELSLELTSALLASTLSQQITGSFKAQPRNLRVWTSDKITPKINLGSMFFTTLSTSIEKMVPTLRELDVGNVTLSFDQFKKIIHLFQSSETLSALHLSVEELVPEVFLSISNALPDLRLFTIRYEFLNVNVFSEFHWYRGHQESRKVAVMRPPTAQFIEAKQVHNFSHWALEHLRIQPLRYPPWISCKHAIADTFPNVKTFNGASREEYLSSNYMDRI